MRIITLIGHVGVGKRTVARILQDKFDYGIFDVEEPIKLTAKLFGLKDTSELKEAVSKDGIYWGLCINRYIRYSEKRDIAVLGISSKMEIDKMLALNSHFFEITGGVSRNGCEDLLSEYVRKHAYMRKIHNNLNHKELSEKINTVLFDISKF
jgi:hypothetical protein